MKRNPLRKKTGSLIAIPSDKDFPQPVLGMGTDAKTFPVKKGKPRLFEHKRILLP